MSELHYVITCHSPLAVNARKPGGSQYQEGLGYVPGRVLRGALANRLLRTTSDRFGTNDYADSPVRDLCRALLNGHLRFRDAHPIGPDELPARLLPATALTCKDYGGFCGDADGHGIFDTLLDRSCWEELRPVAYQYRPVCPRCGGRVRTAAGAYTVSAAPPDGSTVYRSRRVAREILTRVAINRRRQVAEDTLLYAVNALSPHTPAPAGDPEDFLSARYAGSIWLPDPSLVGDLTSYLTGIHTLGSGTSRGLGQVTLSVVDAPARLGLDARMERFNDHLRRRWRLVHSLDPDPAAASGATDGNGAYFSITLQSDALFFAEDGWSPTLHLSPELLWHSCGEPGPPPSDLRLVRTYAAPLLQSGWNAIWGLRKPSAVAAAAGSVYLFQTATLAGWAPRLQRLEQQGIGRRLEEGYGHVRICDEFHFEAGGTPR